jgi:type 1 fimbria pilin
MFLPMGLLKGIFRMGKAQFALAVTGLALLNAPAVALHNAGWGRVSMQGSIIETACAIEMNSREQVIEMATVPLSQIARQGEGIARPFTIRLVNCTLQHLNGKLPDWKAFRITFDGDARGDLLRVSGDAHGVALRISDRKGNIARPGEPMPSVAIEPGDRTLRFTMHLVSDNHPLKAGTYHSVVRFKMDYY